MNSSGSHFAVVSGPTVDIWATDTMDRVGTSFRHAAGVGYMVFSPADPTVFATRTGDRAVRFWNFTRSNAVETLATYGRGRTGLTLDADGRRLATWSAADRTVDIRDARGGLSVEATIQLGWVPGQAAFSPDGSRIVVAVGIFDGGRPAEVWTTDGDPRRLLLLANDTVPTSERPTSVAYAPDGSVIATGSYNNQEGFRGVVRFWNAESGMQIGDPMTVQINVGWNHAIAFNRDGTRLLIGTRSAYAQIWDVETRLPVSPLMPHTLWIDAVAYTPDGSQIATASADGMAQIWDATGRPSGRPLAHESGVECLAFSPDGRYAATGTSGGNAQLWEIDTGQRVGMPMPHSALVRFGSVRCVRPYWPPPTHGMRRRRRASVGPTVPYARYRRHGTPNVARLGAAAERRRRTRGDAVAGVAGAAG
ncbi:MAG: WD40 repeat domain-containing protein [Candidatus Poribacteria bacterium]